MQEFTNTQEVLIGTMTLSTLAGLGVLVGIATIALLGGLSVLSVLAGVLAGWVVTILTVYLLLRMGV